MGILFDIVNLQSVSILSTFKIIHNSVELHLCGGTYFVEHSAKENGEKLKMKFEFCCKLKF